MALLSFRRLGRAKHFKCCVLPRPAQQSMPFTLNLKAPLCKELHLLCLLVFLKSSLSIYHFRLRFRRPRPANYSIRYILRFRRKISMALSCLRSLSRAKYCMGHVFEASALQSIAFTVCRGLCGARYRIYSCFQRLSQAYLGSTEQNIKFIMFLLNA